MFSSSIKSRSVHFIGIGGIGMSALARWFKAQKWAVSGSDLTRSEITRELNKEGLKVKIGHKKGHIPARTSLVIYSQAIKRGNPELAEARRRKMPALSYPEAIGELTRNYETIAIAGAHGKSTTTALAALILARSGLDPTVIIGTKLKEFGGKNFRAGKSKYLILEADEFGEAFHRYSPTISIVTNIDREHLDVYKNLAGVKKAFLKFILLTKTGGALVLNKDDKNLFSLSRRIRKVAKNKKLRLFWYSTRGNTARKIRRIIKISGDHNVSNAVAAYKVGRALGIQHGKILAAIAKYRGAWRRMEYRGEWKMENGKWKIKIFDDYAHHPTEIKATLVAFREKFPNKKIICVFQPHQAERLRLLFKDFVASFDDANVLVIAPIYKVVGREMSRFDSRKLSAAIHKKYPRKPIFYLNNLKSLKKSLSKILYPLSSILYPPLLIMMGAGDIVNYTKLLLK